MMHDQADELRQLVRQRAVKPAHLGPGAPLVVVAGGKPGVGTTTIAVNLAVALARQGRRAVLVDGDLNRVGPPIVHIPHSRGSVVDVLGGRYSVHEVLERGPSGIQVLGGVGEARPSGPWSSTAQSRFVSQLRDLAPHAEVVVVDVGPGREPLAASLWHAADAIVVVTTGESLAIMDAYAAIKALARHDAGPPLHIMVNQTSESQAALDVQDRIAEACRRFLGVAIQQAGHVPSCPPPVGAESTMIFPPRGESARALDRAADTLWAQLQVGSAGVLASKARQARSA
jgi:flagellar biosynthesis protein FlhG